MYELISRQYKASWAGLARVMAWTLFFLWGAGLMLPQNMKEVVAFGAASETAGMTSMLPFFQQDHRLTREDAPFERGAFNIAWICDSTCITAPPEKSISLPDAAYYRFTPAETLKALQKRFPTRRIRLYLYATFGYLQTDELALTARIIEDKPDMIVFHANLMTLYDVNAFGPRKRGRAALARLWWTDPARFGRPLAFFSPADQMHVLADPLLPVVREMPHFSAATREQKKTSTPVAAGTKADNPRDVIKKPDPVLQLKAFWHEHDEPQHFTDKGALFAGLYPGTPDPATYIYDVVDDTLARLAASRIPTLIYPTAMAPFYRDNPVLAPRLKAAAAALRETGRRYDASQRSLVITGDIPDDVIHRLVFRPEDPTHQVKSAAFSDFMAAEIAAVITATQPLPEKAHGKIHH